MRKLYLSTDSSEAKRIMCNQGNLKSKVWDIDMISGSYLVKRIGFNPMSVIEFPDNVSDRHIQGYIPLFAKEGIFSTLLDTEGRYVQNKPDEILYEGIARGLIRPQSSFSICMPINK
ncbi:hypothetical protein J4427_00605 [Candidatus Woesearchaeota archaeon]|nr:hypothetical protein [Candidatus Woesearchaeota archaeon]